MEYCRETFWLSIPFNSSLGTEPHDVGVELAWQSIDATLWAVSLLFCLPSQTTQGTAHVVLKKLNSINAYLKNS